MKKRFTIFALLCLGFFVSLTGCKDEEVPAPDPVAKFSVSGGNCDAPCTVNFTNTSENANSYEWNFGDGNSSTVESPSHTFTSGGTYSVVLKAINADGVEKSTSQTVSINAKSSLTKTQKLTAKPWKLTGMSIDPAYDIMESGTAQSDWFKYYLHACEKDNILKFYENELVRAEEGSNVCDGDESGLYGDFIMYPEDEESYWNFNIAEDKITVDGFEYNIVTLSETKFVYTWIERYDDVNYEITISFTN